MNRLSDEDRAKITVIATEPCIEEWICISLGLSFDKAGKDLEKKPDRVLKDKMDYKKSNLPKYVSQLDFKKLMNESESFRKLIDGLGGI